MSGRTSGERLGELGPLLTRAVTIAALAIVAVFAMVVLTRSGDSYEVAAIFDDVRGLIPGAQVTAGFQKVGTVEDVYLDSDDGLAHVTMRIGGDFQLHQGTFANIREVSNVGAVNRVVDLTTGDESAPELGDGATLGPSHTDQPVDLDVAVSTLDPKTREDAAALLAGLDRSIRGRGNDLNRTLRHSSAALNETANLLGQVNSDDVAIQSLVDNASTVVQALAANSPELGATADRTATLLRVTAGRQLELQRSVQLLGPSLASARGTLEKLTAAVPSLRNLVAGAKPLVTELGPLSAVLPPASAALEPVLNETRKLVEASPNQLERLEPSLDRSLPLVHLLSDSVQQLNPFLEFLRIRIPEITSFFQVSGDATSDYDANGNLVRATVPLIQTDRHPNVIAPSENVPGRLAPPFIRTPGAIESEPWTDYADSYIGGGPLLP